MLGRRSNSPDGKVTMTTTNRRIIAVEKDGKRELFTKKSRESRGSTGRDQHRTHSRSPIRRSVTTPPNRANDRCVMWVWFMQLYVGVVYLCINY